MKKNKRIAELRMLILNICDLRGGFHNLAFWVWKQTAENICQGRDKKYLPEIMKELKAADERRKELYQSGVRQS